MKRALCILILVAVVPVAHAAPPGLLNHQGRIAVGGTNFDGTGHFKFALVDAAGTASFWSNDGSSTGAGEPAAAVAVTVVKGHYAVPLGDTAFHASMNNPIAADIFATNSDVRLRVWFSQSGTGGSFEALAPDRRVSSAGYALSAQVAQAVPDGTISEAMLADAAVTSGKISNGAIGIGQLAPGAAAANIDATGSLGIGLGVSSPKAAVHLDGEFPFYSPALLAELKDGVGPFHQLEVARSVHVSGTIAYVASREEDAITIIDVSDPAVPVPIKVLFDGFGGFNELEGANFVHVSGTTAYVTSYFDSALTIIDVSNPAAPVFIAAVKDGVGGFNGLGGASSVQVSGTTAYVTSLTDDTLTIIDVSIPSAPILLAELKDGIGGFDELRGAISTSIVGQTAYVASAGDNSLTILDVTVPSAPVLLAQLKDGVGGFNELNGAISVSVSGGIACVASINDDALTIIDVSNPAAPILLAELKDGVRGFDELDGARAVTISGTTIYVASAYDASLTILDATLPSAPVLLSQLKDEFGGFNEMSGAGSIQVVGTTLYLASFIDDSLTIIDVGNYPKVDLATVNRVGIGTTKPAAMLHVEGDAFVSGSLLDSNGFGGRSGQFLSTTSIGTDWIDLLDNDPSNELQTLSFGSGLLSLSLGGGDVPIGDLATAIPDEAITAAMLTDGAVSGLDSPDGVFNDVLRVDAEGRIGIGRSSTGLVPPTLILRASDTFACELPLLVTEGDFLYAHDDVEDNLWVLGITNPDNFIVHGFTGVGDASDLAVQGSFAYLLSNTLRVIDVSDPDGPVGRGSIAIPNPSFQSALEVEGDCAYVVDRSSLHIFDVSDPDTIVARDSDATGLDSPKDLAVDGDYAYVIDSGNDSLRVFDISDPDNIVPRGFHDSVLDWPNHVQVQGGFAYVTDLTLGLQIFDVSDPDNIQARDSDNTDLSSPGRLALDGPFAFVTDGSEVTKIFDVSDPSAIIPGNTADHPALGRPKGITIKDRFAYIGDDIGRLSVYEIGPGLVLEGSLQLTEGVVMFADGSQQTRAFGEDAVTTADIVDGTITGADIADGTITSVDIAEETITEGQLADDAVTWEKIAANSVFGFHIFPGSIFESKLADNAVSSAKIADGTVTSADIANGTITGADLTAATLALDGDLSIGSASNTGNDTIYFDGAQSLLWDDTQGRFEFSNHLALFNSIQLGSTTSRAGYNRAGTALTSHGLSNSSDLLVSDDIEVEGTVFADGDIEVGARLYLAGQIRMNTIDGDQAIYFHDDGSQTNESLYWDDSQDRFEFSNEVTAPVFTPTSDRDAKEDFIPIDTAAVLDKVAALPITTWRFKADGGRSRHLGPVAQDFHAAFGLGSDDKHIATVDADGVALAAIQALKAENDALKKQNAAILRRLDALERVDKNE